MAERLSDLSKASRHQGQGRGWKPGSQVRAPALALSGLNSVTAVLSPGMTGKLCLLESNASDPVSVSPFLTGVSVCSSEC